MEKTTSSVRYNRAPLDTINGIPIFTTFDRYMANYDHIAADHLQSLDESGENPWILDETWEALELSTREMMLSVLGPGDRILDAGIGLGRILSTFDDRERYGVDITLRYLERAKERGINVALAKLEQLPYEDDSFEMIVSTDVLEHVLDYYSATKEIVRVLKPGGHLVVRVPFEEDMRPYYEYDKYDYVHVRRFDLYGLRLHFERILGLEYVSHRPVHPVYRGIATSRMRTLDDSSAVLEVLNRLPDDVHGLSEMKDFTHLTSGRFEEFMNVLATSYRDVFEELIPLLAGYLEINIAFRKPLPSEEN